MHNKTLINIGFYLLLLFAFSITIYPRVSYLIAGAIFLIWLLDLLIFRETDIVEFPLFYPLLSFTVVLALGWALAKINGHNLPFVYVALFSLFYLIVPGFVRTGEQRRMILWTFIAGAMLICGLHLIYWWATFTNITMRLRPLPEPSLFMVALAFTFLLAFYAESKRFREKMFLALVALPLALVVILSTDMAAILFLAVTIILLGIFLDRMIFIPLGLTLFFIFSGAFGLDYYIERNLIPGVYKDFIIQPLHDIQTDSSVIQQSSFFGQASSSAAGSAERGQSFFIRLIREAGPPALLLLFWALFERAREAYFKHRRVTASQPRAYHLIALLTIVGIVMMNLYGSVFEYPSIILATWMVLGMSEV